MNWNSIVQSGNYWVQGGTGDENWKQLKIVFVERNTGQRGKKFSAFECKSVEHCTNSDVLDPWSLQFSSDLQISPSGFSFRLSCVNLISWIHGFVTFFWQFRVFNQFYLFCQFKYLWALWISHIGVCFRCIATLDPDLVSKIHVICEGGNVPRIKVKLFIQRPRKSFFVRSPLFTTNSHKHNPIHTANAIFFHPHIAIKILDYIIAFGKVKHECKQEQLEIFFFFFLFRSYFDFSSFN